MKRLTLILSAAAICAVASSQAQASWSVVRFNSGFCQPWDSTMAFKPPADQYKLVSRSYKSFDKAMAKRTKLVAKKKCM
jgi:hypothetical protein